jgi:hypothetical protein
MPITHSIDISMNMIGRWTNETNGQRMATTTTARYDGIMAKRMEWTTRTDDGLDERMDDQ